MEQHNGEMNRSADKKAGRFYGGAFGGLVLGCLVVGGLVLGMSHSEFQAASKLGLVTTILFFVIIGAICGERFIEKAMEWLRWF